MNQYDAQELRERLEEMGLEPAEGEAADVVVVHGCAVTAQAMRKTRKAVRAAQRTAGVRRVLLTGCAAAAADGWAAEDGVRIVKWGADFEKRLREAALGPGEGERAHGTERAWGGGITRFAGRTRAYLKVQDVCNGKCSYCIVPRLRGRSRWRPAEEVLTEARRLVAAGYRELVVCGVDVGSYGGRRGGLRELLARLVDVEGVGRIRLSSLHPGQVDGALLRLWRASGKLVPHLHLPLQSGSDRILRRMRRDYDTAGFRRAVELVRSYLEVPAITTDVMVGFPGEEPRDFEATLALLEEVGFCRVHVFPFSPRPGTEAAGMDGRPAPAEVQRRSREVRRLAAALAERYAEQLKGMREEALLQEPVAGGMMGTLARYVRVEVPEAEGVGRLVPVILSGWRRRGTEIVMTAEKVERLPVRRVAEALGA